MFAIVGTIGIETESEVSGSRGNHASQSLPKKETIAQTARGVEVETRLHGIPTKVVDGNVDKDDAGVRLGLSLYDLVDDE